MLQPGPCQRRRRVTTQWCDFRRTLHCHAHPPPTRRSGAENMPPFIKRAGFVAASFVRSQSRAQPTRQRVRMKTPAAILRIQRATFSVYSCLLNYEVILAATFLLLPHHSHIVVITRVTSGRINTLPSGPVAPPLHRGLPDGCEARRWCWITSPLSAVP
jgi:hypothetical protein